MKYFANHFTAYLPDAERGDHMYIGELLCAGLSQSLSSILPWDIPWHDPSHAVFFVALYGALGAIGMGLTAALARTLLKLRKKESDH